VIFSILRELNTALEELFFDAPETSLGGAPNLRKRWLGRYQKAS
jgi:hypothetical protein